MRNMHELRTLLPVSRLLLDSINGHEPTSVFRTRPATSIFMIVDERVDVGKQVPPTDMAAAPGKSKRARARQNKQRPNFILHAERFFPIHNCFIARMNDDGTPYSNGTNF